MSCCNCWVVQLRVPFLGQFEAGGNLACIYAFGTGSLYAGRGYGFPLVTCAFSLLQLPWRIFHNCPKCNQVTVIMRFINMMH
eukprot:5579431-Amphidinium_carterae.1